MLNNEYGPLEMVKGYNLAAGGDDQGTNLLMSCWQSIYKSQDVVQVNIPAESGEMGVLANHVPSIEQLKPGLVEVIEESGGSKQFFRMSAQAY